MLPHSPRQYRSLIQTNRIPQRLPLKQWRAVVGSLIIPQEVYGRVLPATADFAEDVDRSDFRHRRAVLLSLVLRVLVLVLVFICQGTAVVIQ